MTARVCLGAFAGAHGVNGEVKVKTFTQAEESVARYGAVETEDGARRFALKFIRVLKPGLALVSAPEIRTREAAQALAGTRLFVDRARLPDPEEGEFYLDDLVGLTARDETGAALGAVSAIYNFGAGDVLEIKGGPSGPLLVPFTRIAIPAVDLSAGVLTVAAAALAEILAGDEEQTE